MKTAKSLIEEELNWLDAVVRFRQHHPDVSLEYLETNGEHASVFAARIPNEKDTWKECLQLVDRSYPSDVALDISCLQFQERLLLVLGMVHKLLPGALERTLYQHLLQNTRDPWQVSRVQLGIEVRNEAVVPTFTLLAYLYCGHDTSSRLKLYGQLYRKEFEILKSEIIFPGVREMESPLFSQEAILSDDFAFKLLP